MEPEEKREATRTDFGRQLKAARAEAKKQQNEQKRSIWAQTRATTIVERKQKDAAIGLTQKGKSPERQLIEQEMQRNNKSYRENMLAVRQETLDKAAANKKRQKEIEAERRKDKVPAVPFFKIPLYTVGEPNDKGLTPVTFSGMTVYAKPGTDIEAMVKRIHNRPGNKPPTLKDPSNF